MITATRRLLFTPVRVGPLVVRSRIVLPAHLTNYAQDGRPSEQHAAYYAARAAAGVGMIVTEEHSVHPTDWPYEKLIHGFDERVLPGYRRITDAVHRHGVPILAQLNHNGGQGSGMYSRLPLWAPSPIADPLFGEVPKQVDTHDIAEIVAAYAAVARRCVDGGFDGVELQCSHSSIVRAFLSPATNLRDDEFGGSLGNRARLLLRIVAAVREAIGRERALGVRLCGDELIEGGITIDAAVEVARMVEATGQVDYINTSIGVATATLYMIEASMHVPPGYALFVPSAIRRAVRLPVIGVGRFKDPVQAERALQDGHCDMVGVVRGQIADADFVAKARSGRSEDIRLCLSCNQECVGRMGLNRWLGCIENPRAGTEAKAAPGRSQRPRSVLVAGAGPAGLQVAISAAARGHAVTVHERDATAGGQARLAAALPGRAEFGDLVRNQLRECAGHGVVVTYGSNVTAALVEQVRPGAVVVATGARPRLPAWAEGHEGVAGAPRMVDCTDVVRGAVQAYGRVLVIDEVGFHQATGVAELLADGGCQVSVVTPGMVVGQDLGVTLDLETWCMRAASKGIEEATDRVPIGCVDRGIRLLHHPTGRVEEWEADWVVLAVPAQADDGLYLELQRIGDGSWDLHRVGDCVAPRRAHAAVVEGDRMGALL